MADYAVVETGSKQYWVEPNSVIDVEKLLLDSDKKTVELDQVLLAKTGDDVKVGQPVVKGAKVICELVGHVKGDKVISFKFRRRKASETIRGHRQNYTRLRVKEIKV